MHLRLDLLSEILLRMGMRKPLNRKPAEKKFPRVVRQWPELRLVETREGMFNLEEEKEDSMGEPYWIPIRFVDLEKDPDHWILGALADGECLVESAKRLAVEMRG
jgi:hypothetical protein